MTTRISDLHIAREDALPTPLALRQELPCGDAQAAHIAQSRDTVRRILRGEDPRLLVIVGPCSIHDPASAIEYAGRLRELMARTAGLFPIMRVYFEKPRTRMGWKGLIYDPGLDGEGDIGDGTVESPLHRQMASALSAPLGFKNATNGSVAVAIDAIHVAAQPHRFPSISLDGRAIVVTTT